MRINQLMSNKINDIPIRLKFSIVYFLCVLLPLMVIFGLFYINISKEVKLREEVIIDQSIERVQKDIEFLLEGCFTISREITLDTDINEMLDYSYSSVSDYYATYYNELRDAIQRYQSTYNNVIRVSVYTDNLTVIGGGDIYAIDSGTSETAWFQESLSDGKKISLVGWIEDKKAVEGLYYNRVSLVRKMEEFTQFREYNKYLKLDIETNAIETILDTDQMLDYVVVDQRNRVLAASKGLYEPARNSQMVYFNEKSVDNKKFQSKYIAGDDQNKWRIIAVIPKKNLSDDIKGYGVMILVLFIISFVLSGILIVTFSTSYNYRIQLLQKHMIKVQNGDYSIVESEPGKDEIGFLIQTFNEMTQRINGLVNQVLKFEIKDKEHQLESVRAELNFLQSQMDPHFLFNTLNAILVVCNRKNYTEITEIIKYLSKTLRRLLVWDDVMVTVEDELNFIEMYLKIEKFRFQDKFNYSFELEDGVELCKLPKMSIQPFVENACKHGLQAKKEKGEILIRIYMKSNYLYIVIKDNGIGMESHIIDELFKGDNKKSIGMQNVYKRMQLNYHNDFDIKVNSRLGEGTTITMMLPIDHEREL